MTCHICNRHGVTAGHILGHSKSAAKAKASAANGRKGGRPKRKCQCSLKTRLVGDGCDACNPHLLDD